nr:MAG TPA: hypothetical protein [Caudoviricetes sp.]
MSAPDYLYISYTSSEDEKFTKHFIPDRLSDPLFDYMLPRMAEVAPEDADEFEGAFYSGILTIDHVPASRYMAVYKLIMEACDKVEQLKPCKVDLQKALQDDPRYQAV